MARCLTLAKLGELHVAPNPMVGCVIVYKDEIVAEGYHRTYGEAHAEVNAFSRVADAIPLTECDVFVSLEPCSHYGKTPPCADLLIHKHPKRVIIGTLDPHKKVAGRGIKKLLSAGIEIKIGVLEKECIALNKRFVKAHAVNMPYVTLKWAETKNGYMARPKGSTETKQISSETNKGFVHTLRAQNQAILVGAHTVNTDNPLLDNRYAEGKSPLKVVYSPTLSVDFSARLFENGETLVYTQMHEEMHGDSVVQLADISLKTMLQDLYTRGIHSLLVEGGARLLDTFLTEKLWDETIILKSEDEWTVGLKAPWVGIPSTKEEFQNGDLIKYFVPK